MSSNIDKQQRKDSDIKGRFVVVVGYELFQCRNTNKLFAVVEANCTLNLGRHQLRHLASVGTDQIVEENKTEVSKILRFK